MEENDLRACTILIVGWIISIQVVVRAEDPPSPFLSPFSSFDILASSSNDIKVYSWIPPKEQKVYFRYRLYCVFRVIDKCGDQILEEEFRITQMWISILEEEFRRCFNFRSGDCIKKPKS